MQQELRLLILEDQATEAEMAVRQLQSAGMVCQWRRVERESDFRRALAEWNPSVILSDFTLPQFDGLTALAVAVAVAPDIPFIFLSGTIGEERAIEALKRGAVDYVLKTNLARLVPAVTRALEDVQSRRARRNAEESVGRLSRVLQMLSGINTAVVRIRDRDDLLNEACRLAHQTGGYSFAFIALVDPGTRTARPVACSGESSQTLVDAIFTVADSALTDTSVTGRVLRTGQALVCANDLVARPIPQISLPAGSPPTVACLPLIVDGTTMGAFMFGAPERCSVGEEELLLLQEVASNLSFALQYLEKQDAVRYLSYFDPLTGLAKRSLLCERLSRTLTADGAQSATATSVAVFDIEHMSAINDSFGRHVGDLLLQRIADRLKRHVEETEHLAHLGGGTFAMVLRGEQAQGGVESIQQRLETLFNRSFAIEGTEIPATVKAGIASYPHNGEDANALVQNAEAALKAAKSSGEKALTHRKEMNSAFVERRAMEHRLRIALERNQFVLHYQPKLRLSDGLVTGVEALLRWADPERGLIAPGLFLSTLETTGLIAPVGDWALTQAAEDARRWRKLGLAPLRVAVNAAAIQLRRRDFASKVLDAAAGLPAEEGWGLDIEVVEGALLEDSAWCVRSLRLLRSAGVHVAIDDFGTGYSSLSRLSQLPVDTLKIDRYFTSRLPTDKGSCTLVTTIIGLARAFNMTTVAEGVETPEQLEYLKEAGCNESQGYLHSRPLPATDLEALLNVETQPLAATLARR